MFYANDCRVAQWVHKDEVPTSYVKGKGASQMVADLVSADYGWLQSLDGKEEAWVLIKAGVRYILTSRRENPKRGGEISNIRCRKGQQNLIKYYGILTKLIPPNTLVTLSHQ